MSVTIGRRAALAFGAAALAAPALGQGIWPQGPIRFIGIFPPGGGTDILSRIWCQKMAELTGEQFVVENRSGSAGNIGTEAIARSAPDGRTIGLASVAPLAIGPTLYRRLPFDVTKDFTYVSGLWQLPNFLTINNDVPAHTVPELIALVKANPGKYSYASSGSGTTVHLSGAMFAAMAGLDMVHVPYRGGAPAHIDLVAGRVHMMFDNIPQGLGLVREGRLRGLAVTGAKRSPFAPEYPAMAEFLPGFEIDSWGGVMGPAGLAASVVQRLSQLTRQALAAPELIARFQENGATTWFTTAEEFTSFRARNEAAFAPIIRASGAQVD
ncbi:tripartite tricarboxylate transporter substrate binding protein [Siccirubricoccus sp. KC 17139]|uniref:Tripartite tricarboxylate transporter substrate binding protein n=1 Tax=Siccirubricoccus soli TaxID=2899147 RepID=A0ABT1DB94_9PROT|nr:tripartite tricarboxylate transporter substrate binding protein [Siccirubricoccus soli]MCO6419213.1 tripartite tricarboxylate transporter substrate binding protein [Siccirubricoccus soli]MCP2685348.1 tripartite tricarboxylate transporter substrate binding protein [Siccirubricoccus soli]